MDNRRRIRSKRNKKRVSSFLLKISALFVLAMLLVVLTLYKYKPQVFYFIIDGTLNVIKTKQQNDPSYYVEGLKIKKEKKLEPKQKLRSDSEIKFIEKEKIKEENLLAIIVDDGGYNIDFAKRLSVLKIPLTWAIIPYEKNSESFVKIAKDNNIPFLVHFPMQAISDKTPPPGSIGEGMKEDEIRSSISKAFETMPDAIGLNNHRGSLATSNKRLMMPVIEEIKSHKKMFIDSRTSSKSIAYELAKEAKIRAFTNKGFLDGEADEDAIRDRFEEIVKITRRDGNAIVICHFRQSTVDFLEKLNSKEDTLPVRLVTIAEMSELMYNDQSNTD